MDLLPYSYKLQCIAIAEPVRDEEVSIFGPQHIREAYIILTIDFQNVDFSVFYYQFCHVVNCKCTGFGTFLLYSGLRAREQLRGKGYAGGGRDRADGEAWQEVGGFPHFRAS